MDMRMRWASTLETPELNRRIRDAATRHGQTLSQLLVLLSEADTRKSFLAEGYSSLFTFCRDGLHMSEAESHWRVRAARVARRYPCVLDMIERGELHLTAIALLSKPLRSLRGEAALALLREAKHKTRDEVLLMLAQRFPQQDTRTSMRVVEEPRLLLATVLDKELTSPPAATPPEPFLGHELSAAAEQAQAPPSSDTQLHTATPCVLTRVTPRSPGRFALQTMLAQSAHDDLRAVQRLLSHSLANPSDLGQVIARALAIARERLEHTRLAAIQQAERREARASRRAAYIPARVRRAVWKRDGQQCSFVGEQGHRCTETLRLELDHIVPLARGGKSTVENLRVLCRPHNMFFATLAYGERFVKHKIVLARSRASA